MAACPRTALARPRPPQLLVRACWQSFGTGAVAQVAGLLTMLQEELPGVGLTLWANELQQGMEAWLRGNYPQVTIITGTTGHDGQPDQPALQQAWRECDFLLHGPAGSVVARGHLEAWRKHTRKPFGLYGVTFREMNDKLAALLRAAAFVFLGDGPSRAAVAKLDLGAAKLGFVPNPAFLMPQRDFATADQWLADHALTARKFICVVPKLRFTPYWEIYHREPKYAEIAHARQNQQFQESDHQLLVDALIRCLQVPDLKILLCPEMPYAVEVGRQSILAKLPEPLQSRCLLPAAPWLPDVTAALFARAAGVLSFELISAVLATAAGTPALHVRLPNDTNQGQMWCDVGLKDWIVERDQATPAALAETFLNLLHPAPESTAQLTALHEFIAKCQHDNSPILRGALGI